MSPRPILKRSAATHPPNNHPPERTAVHFPPSPALSRTFSAHSPSSYDRSPIVVAPNSCALPERGCPGRTYTLEESAAGLTNICRLPTPPRGHVHPRALEARYSQGYSGTYVDQVPPLIPDLSSESDESDGFISPPLEPFGTAPRSFTAPKYPSSPTYTSYNSVNHSIQQHSAYGPSAYYIPSNPSNHGYPNPSLPPTRTVSQPVSVSSSSLQKSRHRRKTSNSPPRTPSGFGDAGEDDPGYDDDRDIASPSSSPRGGHTVDKDRKRSKRSLCKALATFTIGDDEDSCLGGF